MPPRLTIVMNWPIAFDYQLSLATIEISYIVSKLMLSPEFKPEKLAIAKQLPKQFFSGSLA